MFYNTCTTYIPYPLILLCVKLNTLPLPTTLLLISPFPIPSLQITTLPIPSLQITTLPIPSLQIITLPIPSLQITTLPIPSLQITTLPIPSLQITTLPIPSLQIITLPIPSSRMIRTCKADFTYSIKEFSTVRWFHGFTHSSTPALPITYVFQCVRHRIYAVDNVCHKSFLGEIHVFLRTCRHVQVC